MKKPRVSNNVSTVLYIILGIAIAFGVNQGMGLALSTDMPVVAVESNSMVPTFYKGDLLVLQGVPPEDLLIGDIIVFIPEDRPVPIVHRIVERNPDGTFQTRGDANVQQLSFEKRIEPSQIHGKEIAIVPYLGWVKISVTEMLLPNAIWVILGIVCIYIAYTLYKNYKKPWYKRGFRFSRSGGVYGLL